MEVPVTMTKNLALGIDRSWKSMNQQHENRIRHREKQHQRIRVQEHPLPEPQVKEYEVFLLHGLQEELE